MFEKLPRKIIIMDPRGRITIPEYMRDDFGLPKGKAAVLVLEEYPSRENCKTIFIKKE